MGLDTRTDRYQCRQTLCNTHESDYLSSDGMFSFRASVDSKLSFTIKAETVSLEEFLDLGAHDDEKEFALPIEEVREVRYARAG